MKRCTAYAMIFFVSFLAGTNGQSQDSGPLESVDNLKLVNVSATKAEYQGKSAIRLQGNRPQGMAAGRGARQPGARPDGANNARRPAGDAPRPGAGGARPAGGGAAAPGGDRPRRARPESLAIIKDSDFNNGTIELELAGRPSAAAGSFARGFVGVAFHVEESDPIAYDCFYLRPTNGRADDQLRRNHSCQYMSHPEFPFNVLRRDSPGVYESYVDLAPGEWTKVKIEVDGEKARLYVHDAEQPCLIVNDLKRAGSGGAIALWMEQSTDAYFRNLKVVSK